MPTIKFSHKYTKMPDGFERSRLIAVFVTDRDKLCKEFIEYDTAIVGGGHYPLPRGKLLVLLLQVMESSQLWNTMRRWTPEKEQYYRGSCGERAECEVTNNDNNNRIA